MRNMGGEDMLELVRMRRAPDDMNLPYHGLTRFATLTHRGSQSSMVSFLGAIGSPRYLIRREPTEQLSQSATRLHSASSNPNGMTSNLWKLIFMLDIASKSYRISFTVAMLWMSG